MACELNKSHIISTDEDPGHTEEVYTESLLKPKQVTRTIGHTAHA
jgi:hypothetical protein